MADEQTEPGFRPVHRGWFSPDRIGGTAGVVLGLVAVEEAVRLYHLRTGPLVGDHVMPAAVGILLVIFGVLLMARADSNVFIEKFPTGTVLARLIGSFVILFAYWLLMDRLGYVASTLIVSIGLFKVMSEYGWFKCLLYAAITSAALGYLFMNLLNIPLPSGLISFG